MPSASPQQKKPRLEGRSLGQQLAYFIVPLLVIFLFLMGGAIYFRTRTIVRENSNTALKVVSSSMFRTLKSWSENHDIWLYQLVDEDFQTDILEFSRSPGTIQKQSILNRLQNTTHMGDTPYFSAIMVVRLNESGADVIVSTKPEWETSIPPSLLSLPQDQAASQLLFDDPVIAPGGLINLSSIPYTPSDNPGSRYLIVGISSDIAVAPLIQSLQEAALEAIPGSLQSSNLYLAFQPDILLPIYLSDGNPITKQDSSHPVFTAGVNPELQQIDYTSAENLPLLSTYQWNEPANIAVVIDTPKSAIFTGISNLGPFIFITVFIFALLTVIVVLIAANRLFAPLGRMVEYAEKVASGEFTQRVDETRTDELGVLASAFNRMTDRLAELYLSLESKVEDRTRQIRAAAEVARTATSSPSLDDLLQRSVNLIADRFGYSYVSIYLLENNGRIAVLKETNSEAGKALIANEFHVEVGTENVIGKVADSTQAYITHDTLNDPLPQKDQLLPGTQSETALPLHFSGRVLGVLDIQSEEKESFQPEDIEILTTLADELSAAIHNASLAQVSATVAARARLITEVTSKLSGVLELDDVLETTASALHNALGKPEVMIRLVSPELEETTFGEQETLLSDAETLQTFFPGEEPE